MPFAHGALALTASHGQTWKQFGELMLAFALSSLVGLERQIRGKSAGLRTQTIVGTASALIVLVSKYGFTDVLATGQIVLDPSRVAAQIVSGIGFLGAGLIITRQGAARGLTTAAAVWGTAAIGMAAGAGLPLLAIAVTALHFVVVLVYTPLLRLLPGAETIGSVQVRYVDGKGVLRQILRECAARNWAVVGMSATDSPAALTGGAAALAGGSGAAEAARPAVTVVLSLSGPEVREAVGAIAAIDDVLWIERLDDDD